MFLHNVGLIFCNIRGLAFIRGSIFLNLLEKSAFLASKLGNGPLLEHGPVIEILQYILCGKQNKKKYIMLTLTFDLLLF